MKVYIDLGWDARAVVEVTAAELDVFQRVLDKAVAVESWYGHQDELKAKGGAQKYDLRIVPTSVKLLPKVEEEVTE